MTAEERPANEEKRRLEEDRLGQAAWRKWGPYLSERQWSTVREDYSPDGSAWEYFPHDQARSRAYRWGEDGLAGVSDDKQKLCLAVALWNGRDPILKERLFGLTNHEGNHGEDVKELYYYLDATPTHSYLKLLYKYPHAAYPYAELVAENGRRSREQPEYELLDTGLFDEDRYFDVFVEYAKASPEDLLLRISVHNRGPSDAPLHLLPQLWFRNTWTWDGAAKPSLSAIGPGTALARHAELGEYRFSADGAPPLLFCENETNHRRIDGAPPGPDHPKDAFHDYVVHGIADAANPGQVGTKLAACYVLNVPAGGSTAVRLRLRKTAEGEVPLDPFIDFAEVLHARRAEADAFYHDLQAGVTDADARGVQRQAYAGLVWGKQFYHYNVRKWLDGDSAEPPPPSQRQAGRNADWRHVNNSDVVSMPDKWEYPWYAAWDLAFHCVALARIDPEFAKGQLVLLTREWYMHPNGQLPAYEWSFSDVDPPVHAWAAWRVYQIDRRHGGGKGDLPFLERVFHKLLLNFTWWVNRKDPQGRNIFQGGFLGMDNVGVFDRSAPLPVDGVLDQADGTSWMAMYCLNLMRIALELAQRNPVYTDLATTFFEHFLHIADAMTGLGGKSGPGLWDEEDQFYYDALNAKAGPLKSLRVRSMVGLVPLFAVEVLEPELLEKLPDFKLRLTWYLEHRPALAALVSRWDEPGRGERRLLSLLRGHRMKALLRRMLDETEFLSEHGVRSVSKAYADAPYVFAGGGVPSSVRYVPGDSDSPLFGGNSNWRGPVWFPVNFLIIEALQKFHHYYGDDFTIECPTGSGNMVTILEAADELSRRLCRIFLRDENGRRPVLAGHPKQRDDPRFRDHVLFYEYFHGDDGRGLGASHQTGWTGLVAKLLHPRAHPRHDASGSHGMKTSRDSNESRASSSSTALAKRGEPATGEGDGSIVPPSEDG